MSKLIKYSAEHKKTINSFLTQPKRRRQSSFWDSKDNPELTSLKSDIKDFYLGRQNFTCAYCQQKIEVLHHAAWDTEHIVNKSDYPQFMFEPENLCVACKDCNGNKSNKNVLIAKRRQRVRYPKKSSDYLICHPNIDLYDKHIKVMPGLHFLPKSEKGRATIEVCGLLRFVIPNADASPICVDDKIQLSVLNDRLQKTCDPVEESFLLSEIEEFSRRMREQKRAEARRVLRVT